MHSVLRKPMLTLASSRWKKSEFRRDVSEYNGVNHLGSYYIFSMSSSSPITIIKNCLKLIYLKSSFRNV
ncbi:unnamed protein product [Moneuplotes crassus]|uniref:Uncharacterized protein n=1 Tax=Euplotes crassus TaxID=5936 RepID=A0AAD2DB00_EUPCR|nr:unnamed protein product [Moneuplotes crassus]